MPNHLLVPTQGNYLLSILSRSDRELLEPDLTLVPLDTYFMLEYPHKPIRHVYFMDSGVASVVATIGGKKDIEIGIIGREGMSGSAIVMGNDRSPHKTYMQVAGQAQRVPAAKLRHAIDASASLRALCSKSMFAFSIQTAHTAMAAAQATVNERLARWLLMAHDRIDGDELPLTHEFLSLMLAVRRAGVTVAVQEFEHKNLILAQRGCITIIDRTGIEEIAGDFYGTPEAEFRRLMKLPEPGIRVIE